MTDASISHMEYGRTALSNQNIQLICLTFGVNEKWLREGKGDMMDDDAQLSNQERQLLAFFRELSPLARKMLIEYAEKLVSNVHNLPSAPLRLVIKSGAHDLP
jgi:hypothetical protein